MKPRIPPSTRLSFALASAMAALTLSAGTAQAADLYSSGAKTWDTSTANWGTVPAGPYDTATWNNATPDSAFFVGSVGTVTLGEPISVSNLTFNVNADGYTIAGNTLNFVAGGAITQAYANRAHTITAAITGSPNVGVINGTSYEGLTFAPTSGTVTLGTLSIPYAGPSGDKAGVHLAGTTTGNSAASVSKPGGNYGTLYKDGSGTWTVGNVDVGTIRINGGTLVANGYLRYYYAGLFVNSGGALHYNNPGAVYSGFTMTGGSFLDNSSGAAITTSTYNPPQSWAGDWTFIGVNGANSDLNLGTGAVTLSGNYTVTVQNVNTTLTVGGVIGDGTNVYSLTKAGAGTLKLKGVNTYNGPITVSAGTLSLGNGTSNTALDNSGVVSIASGAVLDLNFTGSDTVFTLFLNGVLQPAGIYYWDGPNVDGSGNNASGGGSGTWSTSNANWDHGLGARQVWPNTTADKAIFRAVAGTVDLQSDITLGEILIDGVDNYTIGSNPEAQSLHFGGTAVIKVDGVHATIRAGITGSPDLHCGAGFRTIVYLDPDSADMTLGTIHVGAGSTSNPELYLRGTTTGNSAVKIQKRLDYTFLRKEESGTWTIGDIDVGQINLNAGKLVINGTSVTPWSGFNFNGGTLAGTGTINDAITVPAAGTIAPGNPVGTLSIIGTLNVSAPANGGAGKLRFELGPIANSDKLAVTGTLTIGSGVLAFNDFVFTDLGGLQNGIYKLITSGGISGTLDSSPENLTGSIGTGTATGTLQIGGDNNDLELVVSGVVDSAYDDWATAKGLTGANNGKAQDPDGDGKNNLYEFAFDGNPLSAANDRKVVGKIATVGGDQVMTLTLPVRAGATFSPDSGDLLSALIDGIQYRIEGSVDLGTFNKNIAEVIPAITAGLPSPITTGWTYRTFTFAAPGTVPTVPKAFLRAKISETP